MGYTITIQRDPPFTLEEWQRLVSSRQDLRLRDAPYTPQNPVTGEVLSMTAAPGDAELLLDGQWVPCFTWRRGQPATGWPGSAVFDAPTDFGDPHSPLRVVARDLANVLGARLVGEEDEEYD